MLTRWIPWIVSWTRTVWQTSMLGQIAWQIMWSPVAPLVILDWCHSHAHRLCDLVRVVLTVKKVIPTVKVKVSSYRKATYETQWVRVVTSLAQYDGIDLLPRMSRQTTLLSPPMRHCYGSSWCKAHGGCLPSCVPVWTSWLMSKWLTWKSGLRRRKMQNVKGSGPKKRKN